MNALSAINTGTELVPELTRELVEGAIENPLRLVPAEWRAATWGFWSKFASLLRSQLDLAANLREWIVEEGLTLPEAQAAFAILLKPERRALIRFPGDVVAELAREVARLVELRKREERRRADALAAEESRKRADPANVKKLLASIGTGGE